MRNRPFTFSPQRQENVPSCAALLAGNLLGGNYGTLSGGLLVVNGGNILIEGSTIEKVAQVGNSWGRITGIRLEVVEVAGIAASYQVVLSGRADRIGGNWCFNFTTEEPDAYTLSILSPIEADHTVMLGFNLGPDIVKCFAPNIVKIEWHKTP
jgi:hypothetical protein